MKAGHPFTRLSVTFVDHPPVPGAARSVLASRRVLAGMLIAILSPWGSIANAYDRYSVNRDATNCRACHGDFRASAPYTSLHDGVPWKNPSTSGNLNLHDGHRTTMLSGDCGACHASAGRFPTYIATSAGGNGLAAISCLGCHGRSEPSAGGAVKAAGLRQHHYRSGVTSCLGCHPDSNPANFTTANEHVFPPFYSMPDAFHPNKPANACNIGGSESAVAPPYGLDNDGDLTYDGAEAECDPLPAHVSTWGRVKSMYR